MVTRVRKCFQTDGDLFGQPAWVIMYVTLTVLSTIDLYKYTMFSSLLVYSIYVDTHSSVVFPNRIRQCHAFVAVSGISAGIRSLSPGTFCKLIFDWDGKMIIHNRHGAERTRVADVKGLCHTSPSQNTGRSLNPESHSGLRRSVEFQSYRFYAKFDVSTVKTLKSTIFYYVTPRSLIDFYRRFGGMYCLYIQDRRKPERSYKWSVLKRRKKHKRAKTCNEPCSQQPVCWERLCGCI
jgi:hypothetical protein